MRRNTNLSRKNLMVNREAIRSLKRLLKAPSESEAVRIAVQDRLALEEAQAALGRIRGRRGLDDIFHRSAPDSRKKQS